MKKNIKTIVYCIFISLLITACNESKYSIFGTPVWQVDNNAGYYENMTAVVKIPDNLAKSANENDQLAAFSEDGQCRGVGVFINGLYFVSIKGAPEERSAICFKYYSAKKSYLYQTEFLFTFDADQIFGTVDEPQILLLTIVII